MLHKFTYIKSFYACLDNIVCDNNDGVICIMRHNNNNN